MRRILDDRDKTELQEDLSKYKEFMEDEQEQLKKEIDAEDARLQSEIDSNVTQLENSISNVNTALSNKINTAQSTLQTNINTVQTTLTNSLNTYKSEMVTKHQSMMEDVDKADQQLQANIDSAEQTLTSNLDTYKSEMAAKHQDMIDDVTEADEQLQANIDAAEQTWESNLNAYKAEMAAKHEEMQGSMENTDEQLQTNLDNIKAELDATDVELQANIDTNLTSALTAVNDAKNELLNTLATTTVITIPAGRMKGDINGDGIITPCLFDDQPDMQTDSGIIRGYVSQIDGYADLIDANIADIDEDGEVNMLDSIIIQRIAANWDDYEYGKYAIDITGVWTVNPNYATEEGQYYKDIAIEGMTTMHSASVFIQGETTQTKFVKAECIEGAIRIYVTRCPIHKYSAIVTYGPGNGTAAIAIERIPALKNPAQLVFTGTVSATYDGSEPITITINDASKIYMQIADGYLQYSNDNATWVNLFALADITTGALSVDENGILVLA